VSDLVNVVPENARLMVVDDQEQPPNLSRLWNIGIDIAHNYFYMRGEWDVAVLNDDAIPPPGWFDAVSHAMRSTTALAGCSHPFNALPLGQVQIHGPDAGFSVATRLAGWAFMLRGESGLRADERLRWWAADDLLSHQARQDGGLVHVGGFPVPNTGADSSTTGVLAEQAARDMQMFVEIVGCRPW